MGCSHLPTLTAAICNYNHAATVERAIRALLNQSRPPDQIVVVDDGSNDASHEVLSRLAATTTITYVRSERNQGFIAAMERALSLATGDYLYPGSADDFVQPGFFEKGLAAAAGNPEAGIIVGQVRGTTGDGRFGVVAGIPGWSDRVLSPQEFETEMRPLWTRTTSLTPATLYRTAAFREVGGYRPNLGPFTDNFAAWSAGLKHGACYIPWPCVNFFVNHGSLGNSQQQDLGQLQAYVRATAALMRSDEFRNLYSEEFVIRWEQDNLESVRGVPSDLVSVRDAFVRSVNWSSPLFKAMAVWMEWTTGAAKGNGSRASISQAEEASSAPVIVNHPVALAQAFVALAPWHRPMMKLSAILISGLLVVQRRRRLINS